MSHDFVVKQSPAKLAAGFFGSLTLVLVSFVMVNTAGLPVRIGGLTAMTFFGIMAALFAWRVTRSEHIVLVLNEYGLADRRMFAGLVPWSQLRAARFHTIYGSHFIELELFNPERFPWRGLAHLNRMTGWSPYILYLGLLDRPAHEVVLAFEGYFEDYLRVSGQTLAILPIRLGAGIILNKTVSH